MSITTYLVRQAALAVVTAGASSLPLLAIAQAGPMHNPPALYKRHVHRVPYFGYTLSGPAEAWVNGRCDRPLQSELPPCIFPTFRWGAGPTFNHE